MTSDIVKEAKEAVEKGLSCGFLVPKLLEVIESQKAEIDILIRKKETLRDEIAEKDAEIEKLREQIKKGDKIYEEAMLNAEAENNNLKQVIETLVKKEINTIKSEAYREFADSLTKKVEFLFDYYPDDLVRVYGAIDNTLEELTEKNDKG